VLSSKISEMFFRYSELNAIDTHHRRTETKLREVLKQAESETNKANSEKEMVSSLMSCFASIAFGIFSCISRFFV